MNNEQQGLLLAHQNAFCRDLQRFLAEADWRIENAIGDPVIWHLQKADMLAMQASGELQSDFEWVPGEPIVDQNALRAAAVELEAALRAGFDTGNPEDVARWNEQFACVLSDPNFAHLWLPNSAG